MSNKIETYCCDLAAEYYQNQEELLIAKLTTECTYAQLPDAEIAIARGVGLTKAQALEAMRKKLNDEIDRLIEGVADEND